MSDAQVKGLSELQAALDALPAKIEANIMRAAMRAGAKVIAAEAKANINSISGDLAASVRFGAKINRGAGRVESYVRAGGRGKKKSKAAFYAHMVENGTAAHLIKARPPNKMLAIGYAQVQHPGSQKKPFMRPAMDNRAQDAVEAVREYIRGRLATKHGINVPAPIDPEAERDEE